MVVIVVSGQVMVQSESLRQVGRGCQDPGVGNIASSSPVLTLKSPSLQKISAVLEHQPVKSGWPKIGLKRGTLDLGNANKSS